MNSMEIIVTVGIAIILLTGLALIILVGAFLLALRKRDLSQHQHSIRRNYPVLSRIRYLSEHISPELR